jgi:hypothetical protein
VSAVERTGGATSRVYVQRVRVEAPGKSRAFVRSFVIEDGEWVHCKKPESVRQVRYPVGARCPCGRHAVPRVKDGV